MAVQILRDTPIQTREALIPFVMAGINMLAATLSARNLLSPQALLVALGLIILGVPCSILFSQLRYRRILLNVVIMIPLLVLTWMLIRGLPGMAVNWSDPWESVLGHDAADNLIVLLHILVIIAAGRSLSLVTQRDLLQTPIPSVSIFLLAAIIPDLHSHELAKDPFALLCLLALSATSLYLFSHSHSQIWVPTHTPARVQRQFVSWMLAISLIVFPLAFVIGVSLQSFNLITMAKYHSTHPFPRFPISLRGGALRHRHQR